MKKLIFTVALCTVMLGMMTSLSAAGIAGAAVIGSKQNALCIDQGQTCVLGGTPCCGTLTCKGKFPNTYCQ